MAWLAFELRGLPTIEPNARRHWSKRSREVKRWKRDVWLITRKEMQGRQPLTWANVSMTRHSAVQPDFDNLAASFKPVLDGLTEAGIIVDDAPQHVHLSYHWRHAVQVGGRIAVEVEPWIQPPHGIDCHS